MIENNSIEKIERNKALCEKYPFLTWRGDPLYIGSYSRDREPTYEFTWEDEVPEGWRKAFCPQMWDELKAILEKADYVNEFEFVQIKEKFGTLRLYSGACPEEIYKELSDWEAKYDELSTHVCINCGKPATQMTTGWITYVCDDCAKEISGRTVPIKDLDEYYKNPKKYWEEHQN